MLLFRTNNSEVKKAAVQALGKLKSAGTVHRLLELTYEELCADPSAVLMRACRFAGLDASRFAPVIQEHGLKILEPRWREMLDPAQVKQVTAMMEPMLARKGYV